jgi:hypothetical protein
VGSHGGPCGGRGLRPVLVPALEAGHRQRGGRGPHHGPAGGGDQRRRGAGKSARGAHEHETTGTARIVRNADGSHRLELVALDTSNGPDLRVWLSDQPVKEGTAGWRVFDDGQWLELGRLKGNKGDQAYAIPAGTDLDKLGSLSIWCKRFAVSFGAATLASV